MITRLHLKNFKCIRDAQVELGPFTVLIGPNDSGKTTLLDAISYLGQLVSPSNQGQLSSPANQARPALASLTWRKTVDLPIEWEVSGESVALEEQDDGLAREVRRTFHYSLALSPGSGLVLREQLVIDGQDLLDRTHPAPNQPIGRGVPEPLKVGNLSLALSPGQTALQELSVHNGPGVRGVVASIASTVKYRLDPEVMRKDAAASSHPVLGPVGENLVATLDAINSSGDHEDILALEKALRESFPTLHGIALPASPRPPSAKSLEYSLAGMSKPRVTIPAELISDGAILLTGFLALAYGNTPEIIFIEEPENGLHPSLLGKVIDLLRKMTTGEVGSRPRQIILTTHSPILLNYVRPEEVRIFRRGEDMGTTITSMSKVPNIQNYLREFSPGELWNLLGEDALIKGAPV